MIRKSIIVPRLTECPFEHPYGYVYMFTNKINGHRYIGKHKYNKPCIDKSYKGSGTKHWSAALKKYGWENFQTDILFWLELNPELTPKQHNDILNAKERYFIELFYSYKNPKDYNESPGGDGVSSEMVSGKKNPMYGKHLTAGEKNYFYGKHFCGELNANWKGKAVTEYQRKFMSNFMKGKEPPNKGVPMSPERLQQHTEAMRKLAKNPEWRKRQQEGIDRRMQNPEWLKHNREYAKTREKAVVQLTKDGVKLNEFDNALEAAKSLGHNSKHSIHQVCRGHDEFAYGYRWMYKTDYQSQK